MINLDNLTYGDKLGCIYHYTDGTYGTFSDLISKSNNGNKVRDPLSILGVSFTTMGSQLDHGMVAKGANLELQTTRNFPTDKVYLSSSVKEVTKDWVDVDEYQRIINFEADDKVEITAIPKDTFLLSDNIDISAYMTSPGISTINFDTTGNIDAKAAFLTPSGWMAYDSSSSTWVNVDTEIQNVIDGPTDANIAAAKAVMSDVTAINALTSSAYANFGQTIKIALVLGIPGYTSSMSDADALALTKTTYSIDKITIDFVGSTSGSPCHQYFNFIYCGRTKEGFFKFLADRVIQQEIPYNVLVNNNFDKIMENPITVTNSEINGTVYMGFPTSGLQEGEEGEYDKYILDDSIIPGNNREDIWHNTVGTYTVSRPEYKDSKGVDVSDLSHGYLVRGNTTDGTEYRKIAYNASDYTFGLRPVMIVVPNGGTAINTPPAKVDLVNKISQLTIGKGIEVDYVAGSTGSVGTFKNLGKASGGYIPTKNNPTPNGKLALIHVGTESDGRKILMADRVIQTNISYDTLSAVSTITIDGVNYEARLPMTQAGNNNGYDPITVNDGEYNNFVTNTVSGTDEEKALAWNTADSLTITGTMHTGINTPYMRGLDDQLESSIPQKVLPSGTYIANNIGWRPVFVQVLSKHIECLTVEPYLADNININSITVDCDCFDANGQVIDWSVEDSTGNEKAAASQSAKTIPFADLNPPTNSTGGEVTTTLNIKAGGDVLATFTVATEAPTREHTVRKFGWYYKGITTKGISFNTDGINSTVSPSGSYSGTVHPSTEGSSFVRVDIDTDRVNF